MKQIKNYLIALSFSLLLFNSCEKEADVIIETIHDTIPAYDTISTYYLSMGGSYANDIYFRLDSGISAYVPRTNWDIAFHTNSFSSTIITNGGSNVELYQHAKDTTYWSTIDTVGITSWTKLYNSDTTWTLGAFERNAGVHPNYGWGEYNSISHDVIGNKLFIIKLTTGVYKKLWIKKKLSTQNKFIIQYANLDGSSLVTSTIDCSLYTSKNFVYFSLTSNSIVDREPEKTKWDFVVTKYIEMVPTAYPVTGILTNTMRISSMGVVSYTGVLVAQMDGFDITSNDYSNAQYVSKIATIGSDWKSFNMGTNTWNLKNDVAYFIQKGDKIYKVYFTKFAGSSNGALEFVVNRVK